MGPIGSVNNNINSFANQLRMNPMLMQQYYMVMQNPNLNPQMYSYFTQMMQMNNMQNNNYMNQQMPSQMNLNQQMPSQMNMNQQMPSQMNMNQQMPTFQAQNTYNSSLNFQQPQQIISPNLNKNSLQINTSFNYNNTGSITNDQNNVFF